MNYLSFSASFFILTGMSALRCLAEVAYEPRPEGEWKRVLPLSLEFSGLDVKAAELTGLPYRAYYIDLGILGSAGLGEAAKPFALNYFLLSGDALLGSVQLDPNLGSIDSFQGNDGVVAALWSAIQLSRNFPATKENRYCVRYLGSASLSFDSLWLHSEADDIVVPIGNPFGRWSEFKAYSLADIEILLKREIEKREMSATKR